MLGISAALLIAAAQAPSPADVQAMAKDFDKAVTGYRECTDAQIDKLPSTVPPEAGVKTVLAACAAQREVYRKTRYKVQGALFAPEVAAQARANSERGDSEKILAANIRSRRTEHALEACIDGQVAKLAASVTAEAAASKIYGACAKQRVAALKNQLALNELRAMKDEWSLATIAQQKAQIANDPDAVAVAKEELADLIAAKRQGNAASH